MGPSRPLQLLARGRVPRKPVSRPAYPQVEKLKGWWEAQLASPAERHPTLRDVISAAQPKRTKSAWPFRIAIAVVAVNVGAGLGLAGWGALQAAGWVDGPAIEAAQREQGASIVQLEATVHALTAAVGGLSARVYSESDREDAANRRMAEIESALAVLRTNMNDMRRAEEASQKSLRDSTADLTAGAARTRSEITRLRTSLGELARQHQPEVTAIRARLDRVEQAMARHNLLGPLRGSIREGAPGRASVASGDSSAAQDGHIMSLRPAQ